MEADKEEDPFASIMKFCEPTASQEAKFPNCPLARESEIFLDSYADQFSSSPDPTPADPTAIVMVSLPGTPQHPEDEPVFHTPPEHHAVSSSEEQNVNDAMDGDDRRNKVRVSEATMDGEPEAKKIRAVEENLDGETVPVGETEVISIDSEDSGDEIVTVNLGEDSLEISSGGRRTNVVQKIDESGGMVAVNGGKECKSSENETSALSGSLEKKCKSSENETSGLSGSLDSGTIDEEILNLKGIIGNRCIEVEQKSGGSGSEKVVKITEDAKMCKDCHSNGGLETDGKKILEIGWKTDDQRIEVIDRETDGKRIEEVRLKTDDKRIEVIDKDVIEDIGQTDGKNTDGIGLETDGEKIEEFGQTGGKKIEESGLQTGGEGTEEIGMETDGKRIQENGLDTNGKKPEDIGMITDADRSENIGHERNGKRIKDIDEFRYTSGDDRRWKVRRRKLPVSLTHKEKEVVESAETEHGLLDFLDELKVVFGDSDGDCEDVDLLETAKRRGLTFPRPRWWSSDGDDEKRAS